MDESLNDINRRVRMIKSGSIEHRGAVIYWMSRDQRAFDNYALLFAIEKAISLKVPIIVIFCLVEQFLHANKVIFLFMLEGLKETEKHLRTAGIPFFLLKGNPEEQLPIVIEQIRASTLVLDFDPLKIKRKWKEEIVKKANCDVYEVDAHNVIPYFIASDKQEYSAFSFRKKISNKISSFLTNIPEIKGKFIEPHSVPKNAVAIHEILKALTIRVNPADLTPLRYFSPGYDVGMATLRNFIEKKLNNYSAMRNDALADIESELSPYIHFGQISAQRIAFEVKKSNAHPESINAYLEQLIVRRELADNFCLYNTDYDSVRGFPLWARQTLLQHKTDRREFVYSSEEFENSKTHDEIWNCAQIELRLRGKIHNYLRMYWGKKILEWASSPEIALEIGNYLNNKYALDGRDPNGYVNVAWCVGGVHDRPFAERNVFGKIRYMGTGALKRNFDIKKYTDKIKTLIKESSS